MCFLYYTHAYKVKMINVVTDSMFLSEFSNQVNCFLDQPKGAIICLKIYLTYVMKQKVTKNLLRLVWTSL